jgi:acetyltransferase-like isoleucine patch superfamily enzyme
MNMKTIKLFGNFIDILGYFRYGGAWYARRIGVNIGDNCQIHTREFGSEPFLIRIGNNVVIAPGVKFVTHDASGALLVDDRGRRFYYAPISIGNNVMIGLNSVIMPGVKIESNVIIGTGSIVTKSIPLNSIVAGVPARKIGDFQDFKRKNLKNWISKSDIDFTIPYKERINKIAIIKYKDYLGE